MLGFFGKLGGDFEGVLVVDYVYVFVLILLSFVVSDLMCKVKEWLVYKV